MTLRDDVWDAVLLKLSEDGSFALGDLPFDEGQRHTLRRVAREMTDKEWLWREDKYQKQWYPGEKARRHLRFSEGARARLIVDGVADEEEFG